MLYLAKESESDPHFGATKLNKMLFYADFMFYGIHGRSITGATYQRLDKGPAPRQLLRYRTELVETGRAELVEKTVFNRRQKRLVARGDVDTAQFSGPELDFVRDIIEVFTDHNALQISELSHVDSFGWQVAGDREEIPYEAVFLSSDGPTASDIRLGQEVAENHGHARSR
jgi:hypothetical protein